MTPTATLLLSASLLVAYGNSITADWCTPETECSATYRVCTEGMECNISYINKLNAVYLEHGDWAFQDGRRGNVCRQVLQRMQLTVPRFQRWYGSPGPGDTVVVMCRSLDDSDENIGIALDSMLEIEALVEKTGAMLLYGTQPRYHESTGLGRRVFYDEVLAPGFLAPTTITIDHDAIWAKLGYDRDSSFYSDGVHMTHAGATLLARTLYQALQMYGRVYPYKCQPGFRALRALRGHITRANVIEFLAIRGGRCKVRGDRRSSWRRD